MPKLLLLVFYYDRCSRQTPFSNAKPLQTRINFCNLASNMPTLQLCCKLQSNETINQSHLTGNDYQACVSSDPVLQLYNMKKTPRIYLEKIPQNNKKTQTYTMYV